LKRALLLTVTHLATAVVGFAAGIFLKGSDFLHWGEGKVAIGREKVAFTGQLAPGPDYKLYFSPEYVDVVNVPPTLDIGAYDTVVVWCERFSMFITSAKYR
jgi:hypothetical protein